MSKDTATTGNNSLALLFANIEKGISLDGNIDIPVVGRFYVNIATLARDAEEDGAVATFIDRITLALFHYLPDARSMQAAALAARGAQHKHAEYMRSCVADGRGACEASCVPAVDALYAALVSEATTEIDLAAESTASALQNETHCMQLLYTTLFVLIQRTEADSADTAIANKSLAVVKQILVALQSSKSPSTVEKEDGKDQAAAEVTPEATSADAESSLNKALRYVYCSRYQLLNTFSVLQKNALTEFVFDLTRHLTSTEPNSEKPTHELIVDLTAHFRMKLTNQIEWSIRGDNDDESAEQKVTDANRLLEMLNVFPLEHKHCLQLSQTLTTVPVDRFGVSTAPGRLFVRLLAFVLRRLTALHTEPLAGEQMAGIALVYEHLLPSAAEQHTDELTDLEEALHDYLIIFYDNIGHIGASRLLPVVFASLERNASNATARKSTIRLCALLAERDCATAPTLHALLPEKVARKELVYPLLNALCRQRHRPGGNAAALATAEAAAMLAAVWTECRPGIMKTTEKPLKAANIYKENVYASLWLIEQCMPLNECVDFCKRTLKSDGAEVYQLQLVKAIHLKALHAERLEVRRSVYEAFVEVGVQLLGALLQQQKLQRLDERDVERVQQFTAIVADWLRALAVRAPGATFAKLIASPAWLAFGKSCLKWGMQPVQQQKDEAGSGNGGAALLKLLAVLCDRFYADSVVSADCERLFEMVLSHSAFFSIALGNDDGRSAAKRTEAEQATTAELKTSLMYLVYVLVKKVGASVLQGAHVPVLLGAYQAKLSDCDRYVLAVLQMYERAGIDMHPYKPFIWGESAVAFYAIRGDAAAATLNQEPPLMQVMSMVDRDTAELTLAQFPVWRKLNAIEQVSEEQTNQRVLYCTKARNN